MTANTLKPACSIVICGSLSDIHVKTVFDRIRENGHVPSVLDAQQFPESMRIKLRQTCEEIDIDGRSLARPAAVYLRSLYQSPAGFGVHVEEEHMRRDWRQTLAKFEERNTLLASVLLRWEALGVPIYNPVSIQRNITKPFQLALLARAGLPVPRTLWTNDPEAVKEFAKSGPVIYKPVQGGAATRELTDQDLSERRLQKLSQAPVTFQERLPGDDIRVYVIDGVIAARFRIVTDAIDFRQNEKAIERIELPEEVERQCIRAAEVLGLRFTGMDLKGDAEGRLRILELNPSAMFLGFDILGKSDILGALTRALVKHLEP